MNKQRPVNLNLFTIKFPLPAIISILHRASGAVLFFLLPFLLWMLYASLNSPVDFDALQDFLASPFIKILLWLFLTAFLYHLAAGLRHLLMDAGVGESLAGARLSAKATIVVAVLLALITGIWLW